METKQPQRCIIGFYLLFAIAIIGNLLMTIFERNNIVSWIILIVSATLAIFIFVWGLSKDEGDEV